MGEEYSLSGDWPRDRIVEFSQQSDFRQHAEASAFRLDESSPYFRLHFVSVYVTDQERSLSFFVDKLGFTLLSDVRFVSGNRWIEVSPPDGTAVLALVLPMKDFNENHLVGNSGLVTFLTEDVERTYREWSERGVHFTIPPQTPAWGGTFCRFVDPDGNSFALAGFSEVTGSIDARRRAMPRSSKANAGLPKNSRLPNKCRRGSFLKDCRPCQGWTTQVDVCKLVRWAVTTTISSTSEVGAWP